MMKHIILTFLLVSLLPSVTLADDMCMLWIKVEEAVTTAIDAPRAQLRPDTEDSTEGSTEDEVEETEARTFVTRDAIPVDSCDSNSSIIKEFRKLSPNQKLLDSGCECFPDLP
jgi:hypothetical protein